MMTIRKSQERGYAKHDWLESFHSFSFADYYDAAHMGYSVLRVINEDKVAAGSGFGMHGHRDMEIITYMLAGELRHQDSMGNGSVIHTGDVQYMSAGAGVRHSEINPSSVHEAHLLQIWLLPATVGLPPNYAQKHFSPEQKRNRWCLVVSDDGREGSIQIQQNVNLYATVLGAGGQLNTTLHEDRRAYLQVAKGEVLCNGVQLFAGDAAIVEAESQISIQALQNAELLLFDLP